MINTTSESTLKPMLTEKKENLTCLFVCLEGRNSDTKSELSYLTQINQVYTRL